MVTQRDYYEILGVSKSATKEELKTAYRKMALKFHPDRNKEADAEAKFKEVNEAYEVLSNPEKRQAYDQFGHSAFDPRAGGFGGTGQAHRQGPFTYTYTSSGGPVNFDFDFSDPFDIFSQFFGGASPFGARQSKPHYSLKIDFMEAIKGAEKTLIHQGKEHQIKIPPGANDGTRIQFQDFMVSLNVSSHPQFKRDGYDIFTDFVIPFSTAALGGSVTVPTVEGDVKLKIRPGTQPHTMVRLRGKGVNHLRGNGKGDHYVRLMVEVPTKLNRDQKKLIEALDESLHQ